jgi:hypothetical protein
MPGRRARQLCPDLVFVGGHFNEYQRLGDAATGILGDFMPSIERISSGRPGTWRGDGFDSYLPAEGIEYHYYDSSAPTTATSLPRRRRHAATIRPPIDG